MLPWTCVYKYPYETLLSILFGISSKGNFSRDCILYTLSLIFCIPPRVPKISNYFTYSPTLVLFWFFKILVIPIVARIEVLILTFLVIRNVDLFVFIGYFYIFFEEWLFKSLVNFWIWLFVEIEESSIFWRVILYQRYDLQMSPPVVWVLTILVVSFQCMKLFDFHETPFICLLSVPLVSYKKMVKCKVMKFLHHVLL